MSEAPTRYPFRAEEYADWMVGKYVQHNQDIGIVVGQAEHYSWDCVNVHWIKTANPNELGKHLTVRLSNVCFVEENFDVIPLTIMYKGRVYRLEENIN